MMEEEAARGEKVEELEFMSKRRKYDVSRRVERDVRPIAEKRMGRWLHEDDDEMERRRLMEQLRIMRKRVEERIDRKELGSETPPWRMDGPRSNYAGDPVTHELLPRPPRPPLPPPPPVPTRPTGAPFSQAASRVGSGRYG